MNVSKPIFEERLVPSKSVIFALSSSGPMMLLAGLPFGPELAITLAVLVPIGLIAGAFYIAPVIQVGETFRRGSMELPLEALGETEIFIGEEARLERGPRLDARARLAIRGDIDQVVKIAVTDALDPTPYLLISTRRPEQLVAALRANRANLGL